jgi:hypothetical protein
MSALIRESHANETTPLWVPAGQGGDKPPAELVALPITVAVPNTPPGVSIPIDVYNTSPDVWYDVNIVGVLELQSGVPNIGDQLQVALVLGTDPTDTFKFQTLINTTTTATTLSFRIRNKNVTADQIALNAVTFGTGTGVYDLTIDSVNVSAVPA